MSIDNRVHLEVDQYSRIGIKDVISDKLQGPNINNENNNKAQQNISTLDSIKKSPPVKGNTNLPQIRELNEIAALLRSMDMHQRQLSS